MLNYFDFIFDFSYGMNSSFKPYYLFSNLFQSIKLNNVIMPLNVFSASDVSNYNTSQSTPSSSADVQNSGGSTAVSANTDTFERTSSDISSVTDTFSLNEYNAFKGKKLAKIVRKNAVGWKGLCATYVKNSIQEAGLGAYVEGHAYKMIEILRKNKNFKEISPNINLEELPEGCVLVYGKGVAGYSNDYGHTEITAYNKRTKKMEGISDGITKNLYKKPSAIFIPV